MTELLSTPKALVLVRHHITHPRHFERFNNWLSSQMATWLKGQTSGATRRYKSEKHKPEYYLAVYEISESIGADEALEIRAKLRREWGEWGPDIRDLTVEAYEPVWWGGRRAAGDSPHPTIITRYSVEPAVVDAFDKWAATVDGPEYLADLEVANIVKYRALHGNPPFQLQIQEFDDEETMRATIKSNEPSSRPRFWEEWARWMPQINSLTRLVFNPTSADDFRYESV